MKVVKIDISKLDCEAITKGLQVDNSKDQYGKTYKYIRRSAKPLKILYFNDTFIKIYHMLRETESLPPILVDGLESFLRKQISEKRIPLRQKVGFAILSQGFLSINMWGRGNVLFTNTYTVEKNADYLSPEPLSKTGVACTWEARIMRFEYEKWQEFLESEMDFESKKIYLTSFISGKLYPEDIPNSPNKHL
jgi:hypothetical protein